MQPSPEEQHGARCEDSTRTLPTGPPRPRPASLYHPAEDFPSVPFSTNQSGRWHILAETGFLFAALTNKYISFDRQVRLDNDMTFPSNALNERYFANLHSKLVSKECLNVVSFITATEDVPRGLFPTWQFKWVKINYFILLTHVKYIIINMLYSVSQIFCLQDAYIHIIQILHTL